ncbi:hypothetical protein ABPG73_013323 [Tetrahymena malaccensis]
MEKNQNEPQIFDQPQSNPQNKYHRQQEKNAFDFHLILINEFSVDPLQNSKMSFKKQGIQKKINSIKSMSFQDCSSIENQVNAKMIYKNQKDSIYKQENTQKQISRNLSLFYQEEKIRNKQISQNEEEVIDIFEEQSQLQKNYQIEFKNKKQLDSKQLKQIL